MEVYDRILDQYLSYIRMELMELNKLVLLRMQTKLLQEYSNGFPLTKNHNC